MKTIYKVTSGNHLKRASHGGPLVEYILLWAGILLLVVMPLFVFRDTIETAFTLPPLASTPASTPTVLPPGLPVIPGSPTDPDNPPSDLPDLTDLVEANPTGPSGSGDGGGDTGNACEPAGTGDTCLPDIFPPPPTWNPPGGKDRPCGPMGTYYDPDLDCFVFPGLVYHVSPPPKLPGDGTYATLWRSPPQTTTICGIDVHTDLYWYPRWQGRIKYGALNVDAWGPEIFIPENTLMRPPSTPDEDAQCTDYGTGSYGGGGAGSCDGGGFGCE